MEGGVMVSAAGVVLIVPIAVDTALGLGVNYLTFIMGVVIGRAISFLTQVGHKANVLVFGPGGSRFSDYPKVGILLTIVLFVVSMVFLPIIWPFQVQEISKNCIQLSYNSKVGDT